MSNSIKTEKNEKIVENFGYFIKGTLEGYLNDFISLYGNENEEYNANLIGVLKEVFEEISEMDEGDQEFYLSLLSESVKEGKRENLILSKVENIYKKDHDLTVEDIMSNLPSDYSDGELKKIRTRLQNAYDSKKHNEEELKENLQSLEEYQRNLESSTNKEDKNKNKELIQICEMDIDRNEYKIVHSQFVLDNASLLPWELKEAWDRKVIAMQADKKIETKKQSSGASQNTKISPNKNRNGGLKMAADYKGSDPTM